MKTLFFILAITYCSSLLSQQVVTTAGSTLSNSSGGISYTIGEGISETLTSGDITLTQGYQQSSIFVSLVSELKDAGLSVNIYPNPTIGNLNLSINEYSMPGLQYLLSDCNGKLLSQKKLESYLTTVSMSHLRSGIYFIKIQAGTKELKTFKIVKE